MDVEDLDTADLVELLMVGASGLYPIEAAVRLLDRHGYWLKNREFLKFVRLFGDPVDAAGIDWSAALSALDAEVLASGAASNRNVLRIAGSLCTFYNLALRDVLRVGSWQNVKDVSEAFMYASGFLGATAVIDNDISG